MLARDQAGELFGVGHEPFAEAEHDPRALSTTGVSAQDWQRLGRRLHGAIDLMRPSRNGTVAMMLPSNGLYTGPNRADRAWLPPASDEHLGTIEASHARASLATMGRSS